MSAQPSPRHAGSLRTRLKGGTSLAPPFIANAYADPARGTKPNHLRELSDKTVKIGNRDAGIHLQTMLAEDLV